MAIKKLSYENLVTEAIEEGYAKNAQEARAKICENIIDSFLTKCVKEKIDLDNPPSKTIVGYSTKYDCFFVRFRDVYFEVYFNEDLLLAGLEPHVFVQVKLNLKLDELKDICKQTRPDVPLTVNYFQPIGRKFLN